MPSHAAPRALFHIFHFQVHCHLSAEKWGPPQRRRPLTNSSECHNPIMNFHINFYPAPAKKKNRNVYVFDENNRECPLSWRNSPINRGDCSPNNNNKFCAWSDLMKWKRMDGWPLWRSLQYSGMFILVL